MKLQVGKLTIFGVPVLPCDNNAMYVYEAVIFSMMTAFVSLEIAQVERANTNRGSHALSLA